MSNTEHDHNQPDRRDMNFENKKEQELRDICTALMFWQKNPYNEQARIRA